VDQVIAGKFSSRRSVRQATAEGGVGVELKAVAYATDDRKSIGVM